ncbi:MAG: hypothetical protein Q9171_005682 [Xanthocarpia ochracea]
MPSIKMTLGQRLALERELDRRAVEAGLVPATPVVKLTAIQASLLARKTRTLASLGPKVAAAARKQMRNDEMEAERQAFQLKREQLERRVSAAPTQGAARKKVAWAACERQVHMVESYLDDNKEIMKRYAVAEDFIEARRQIDSAGGWIVQSPMSGVHRSKAPGMMSVDGYRSMPDDWKDFEDIMDDNETF